MISKYRKKTGNGVIKKPLIKGFLLWGLIFPVISYGYEVETHEAITNKALLNSETFQNNGQYLIELGITKPFDPVGTRFTNSKLELLSIADLFSFGARYEDHKFSIRPLNHFFDPSRTEGDQALHFFLYESFFPCNGECSVAQTNPYPTYSASIQKSFPSPDWALEDKINIDDTSWYDGGQQHSWRDARYYFYQALTAKNKKERDDNWGATFQTLGQVVHHIQDMAQPQHVRNEIHDPLFSNFLNPYIHASLYESFTNNPNLLKSLNYNASPAYTSNDSSFKFATPRDFWVSKGRGIAEFTRGNFFSSGTNIGSEYYKNNGVPSLANQIPIELTLSRVCQGVSAPSPYCSPSLIEQNGNVKLRFFSTSVNNLRTGTTSTNGYATTESIFNPDLTQKRAQPLYTLNWMSMIQALNYLIPEATAYSTGLINFFFRGKIDMVEDPNHSDQYLIKNLGNEPLTGTFELYYDSPDGKTRTFLKSWELKINPSSNSDPITFTPPTQQPKPSYYILVFKGAMGLETVESGGSVAGKIVPTSRIAFTSFRDGNPEIYVMNADGSNQINLTNSPANEFDPVWSPDNSRIGFWKGNYPDYNIYVMNADGSNQIRLTNTNSSILAYGLAWSPDGSRIAFTRESSDSTGIYVVNADGSNQTLLSSTGFYPSWSPDGSRIAFLISSKDTNGVVYVGIYVINADGSNQIRLINSSFNVDGLSWSPDGSRIAFVSGYEDDADEIYIINADGSNQIRLTNSPGLDYEPTWSPDGNRIAFTRESGGYTGIYVMNADGSNQVRLSNSPGLDRAPAWSH